MPVSAICLIPNCGRAAPPSEPFCPAHRDDRADLSALALRRRVKALENENIKLRAALGECVSALVEIDHSRHDRQWDGSPLDERQQAAVTELRRLIAQGRAAIATAQHSSEESSNG